MTIWYYKKFSDMPFDEKLKLYLFGGIVGTDKCKYLYVNTNNKWQLYHSLLVMKLYNEIK